MKCLLYIDNENKEIEYEIGESIKVGDHFPINGKEYTVFNILLDSNQEYPIVYLKL